MHTVKQISVTSTPKNLRTELVALGYDDSSISGTLHFINNNAETVYIHLTASGTTAPAGGDVAKGIPIGTGATAFDNDYRMEKADAGTIWLYAANAVTILVVAQSAG